MLCHYLWVLGVFRSSIITTFFCQRIITTRTSQNSYLFKREREKRCNFKQKKPIGIPRPDSKKHEEEKAEA